MQAVSVGREVNERPTVVDTRTLQRKGPAASDTNDVGLGEGQAISAGEGT
jgi:hypothetical protein